MPRDKMACHVTKGQVTLQTSRSRDKLIFGGTSDGDSEQHNDNTHVLLTYFNFYISQFISALEINM